MARKDRTDVTIRARFADKVRLYGWIGGDLYLQAIGGGDCALLTPKGQRRLVKALTRHIEAHEEGSE